VSDSSPTAARTWPTVQEFGMVADLYAFVRYFEMIEAQVAALPRDFPGPPEADPGVLGMLRELHEHQIEHYFPQLTRYSAIVTAMTMFEDQAHLICEALRALKTIPIAWTELTGDPLKRFRAYTTKMAGLKPPDALDWERLKAVHTIRGAIVHANGYARGAWKDQLEKLVGKVDGFSIGADGRVQLEPEAWRFALTATANVLRHIYEHAPAISPVLRAARDTPES